MYASGWKSGRDRGTFGIRVGRENAELFFQRQWRTVTLFLDGAPVEVNLTSTFWARCPELRSAEVTRFFAKHGIMTWQKGKPPKLEVTPLGGKSFSVSLR